MTDRKRIQYIDIYRGVGILLMVMGHIGIWGTFDYWIHAFHMPMFFFIAGYLYQDHLDSPHYLLTKMRSMLIPYLCYGILAYAVYLVLRSGPAIPPLIHLFTDNTTGVALSGAIWFLTALLWVYVIYLIIEKMAIRGGVRTVLYYALAILGCLETRILPVRLPLALGPALVGVGMFHTARLIRDDNGIAHRMTTVSSPLVLVLWAILDTVLIMVSPEVNMRTGSYPDIVLFWINAISSSLLLLNMSREFENRTQDIRVFRWINREISYIGSNSMVYVCLNLLILYLLEYIWDISGYNLVVRSAIKIMRFLIAMAIMRLWCVLVNRTWLRVTIGK